MIRLIRPLFQNRSAELQFRAGRRAPNPAMSILANGDGRITEQEARIFAEQFNKSHD
jgi:hypothetical protein